MVEPWFVIEKPPIGGVRQSALTLSNGTLSTEAGMLTPDAWKDIAIFTLGTNAQYISFSNLPPTNYLQIIIDGTYVAVGNTMRLFMQFNGSGATYTNVGSLASTDRLEFQTEWQPATGDAIFAEILISTPRITGNAGVMVQGRAFSTGTNQSSSIFSGKWSHSGGETYTHTNSISFGCGFANQFQAGTVVKVMGRII